MKKDYKIVLTDGLTNEVIQIYIPFWFSSDDINKVVSIYIKQSISDGRSLSISYSY